jgi:hypothetical protein
MNAIARPWIGLAFKLLAMLAAIFAFVFFMTMDEEASDVDRYRSEGVVSRAVVTGKDVDQIRYSGRAGRSRTQDVQILEIRFAKDSPVAFADFPDEVSESELPVPPTPTGDPLIDGEFVEVIFVPQDVFNRINVGDMLTVVDTPYSGDGPEFHADIAGFDPSLFYPRIAIALVLMVVFAFIGWRISRASAVRGAAQVAPMSEVIT